MTESILCHKHTGPKGAWVELTLNQEKALNSISLEMIEKLTEHLKTYLKDESVKAIVLRGAGEKAFCAGGDIRRLYESLSSADKYYEKFFLAEYSLDYFIHQYPKPIIVWGSGIVMGGGLGLMIGASHRIVTETTKLAMPEITIGLFPDVGGSYFLNKAPGRSGIYLGYTGTRLNADDCIFAGFADYKLSSQDYSKLTNTLTNAQWKSDKENHDLTKNLLKEMQIEKKASALSENLNFIEGLLGNGDPLTFKSSATKSLSDASAWIKSGLETFLKGCPTSAFLVYEQLLKSKHMNLKEVFDFELGLAYSVCEHFDFKEGVRALLIDRDMNPKWKPENLESVSRSHIEGHFKKSIKIRDYMAEGV